jgi:hypothetical protein
MLGYYRDQLARPIDDGKTREALTNVTTEAVEQP